MQKDQPGPQARRHGKPGGIAYKKTQAPQGLRVRYIRNAVHLSGAALRFTGKRVFDIFTALGLDGLGRFSMN
ncbi:hypothetical protein, partial [Aeromonas caviae]